MKKLITFRAAVTLLLLVAGITQASAKWVGASAIYVNDTWYYAGQDLGAWCSGGAFNGVNLGTITSLKIAGQSQVFDGDNNDWHGGTMDMHYKIDNGSVQTIILTYYGFSSNNNKFQSGGSSFSYQYVDISGLSAGEHTISVWFESKDINQENPVYDDNDHNNYVATFTIPVSQSVTVSDAGYATFVSPLALNFSETEIKAYTAEVNTTSGLITLTQINNVPENVPVVLYKAGGKTENIPVWFPTVNVSVDNNDLIAGTGATVPTSDSNGNYNYILNDGVYGIGFYKANDQTVATNRAYLQTTYDISGQGARMTMVFADEATGITNIETTRNNRYFDLQGRNVAQPTKGLYIVNGKKVIIK